MQPENDRTIPDAMSHRTLIALLQSAEKEQMTDSPDHDLGASTNQKLRNWSRETMKLLDNMASNPESFGLNRSKQQVMALGSFRTHLMLGLQALKASQS